MDRIKKDSFMQLLVGAVIFGRAKESRRFLSQAQILLTASVPSKNVHEKYYKNFFFPTAAQNGQNSFRSSILQISYDVFCENHGFQTTFYALHPTVSVGICWHEGGVNMGFFGRDNDCCCWIIIIVLVLCCCCGGGHDKCCDRDRCC